MQSSGQCHFSIHWRESQASSERRKGPTEPWASLSSSLSCPISIDICTAKDLTSLNSLSLSGSFPETLSPVPIVEPVKALLVTICTCTQRTAAKQDYYDYYYILLSNRTSKQKIRTAHISLPKPPPLLRKTICLPRAKRHYNKYRRYEEWGREG